MADTKDKREYSQLTPRQALTEAEHLLEEVAWEEETADEAQDEFEGQLLSIVSIIDDRLAAIAAQLRVANILKWAEVRRPTSDVSLDPNDRREIAMLMAASAPHCIPDPNVTEAPPPEPEGGDPGHHPV